MAEITRMRALAVVLALLFLGVNLALFRFVGEAEAYPQRRSLAEFPSVVGAWRCPRRTIMGEDVFRISEVDDYLLCNFVRPAKATQAAATTTAGESGAVGIVQQVNVYVGYHARQMRAGGTGRDDQEAAIHPPKHCLPGAGWDIVDAGLVEIAPPGLPGGAAKVNRFTIAKGNQRQLVYYWYQSRGRVIASDWQKVAYLALDRVLRQRTDGALVRFTVPIQSEDVAAADAQVQSILSAVVPRLPDFLPE